MHRYVEMHHVLVIREPVDFAKKRCAWLHDSIPRMRDHGMNFLIMMFGPVMRDYILLRYPINSLYSCS
jgi:hypothetical protein